MAELVWTEPAIADLDAIADYIALDDFVAASALVSRVFQRVKQLEEEPESGSWPRELLPTKTYRQLVEKPCRIFYRWNGESVYILHVMRGERVLRLRNLER